VYDITAIAQAQTDEFKAEMEGHYTSGVQLTKLTRDVQLLCDTSVIPRPIVPEAMRFNLFQTFHNLSHPNWKATSKLILARFTWPAAKSDIKRWCRECLKCQQSKISRHTKTPVETIRGFPNRFEHVHMDIVGPLPSVSNSTARYVISFIDRATNWVEVQPVDSITAESVAQCFLFTWFARFGVPLFLTTDRGSQFESDLFSELSKVLGFARLRTTAYHPQANGKIERYHRILKSSLIASGLPWTDALPIVIFGHRITPNDDGISPFQLVTGADALLPHHLLSPTKPKFTADFVKKLANSIQLLGFQCHNRNIAEHSNKKSYVPKDLRNAKYVWLRVDRTKKPLEAPYTGPHAVIKFRNKTATIKTSMGETVVSIDRLKPCFLNNEVKEKLSHKPDSINIPEKLWCICKRTFDSQMIACDAKNCPVEWYHFKCVGVRQPPIGEWFCPNCRVIRSKRTVRFSTSTNN
jgi:cleavage and polyadenylation specificity factor subunit 1